MNAPLLPVERGCLPEVMMFASLATRILRTTDRRCLWKFAWNFGVKGMLSVQKFKRRIRRGECWESGAEVKDVHRRYRDAALGRQTQQHRAGVLRDRQ